MGKGMGEGQRKGGKGRFLVLSSLVALGAFTQSGAALPASVAVEAAEAAGCMVLSCRLTADKIALQLIEDGSLCGLVYSLEDGRLDEVTFMNAVGKLDHLRGVALSEAIRAAEMDGYEVLSATLRPGAISNLIVRKYGTERVELLFSHDRGRILDGPEEKVEEVA